MNLYPTCRFTQGRVAQSVQRLATGWTVQGSNPDGGEIFHTCPERPWGPPSLLYNGYRVLPGGKERLERGADPSPPSSAVVMKEQSYTSTPPMGRRAYTEPQCLYKGALYLYLSFTQHQRIRPRDRLILVTQYRPTSYFSALRKIVS